METAPASRRKGGMAKWGVARGVPPHKGGRLRPTAQRRVESEEE